jgi:hypothetical protein
VSPDAPIPEMRAFAMSLLVVATGDTRTIPKAVNIVHNAAFRYSLELLGNFPDLARRAKPDDLSLDGWLAGYDGTQDFFVLCGHLLDAVDRRVRGRHSALHRVPGDEPSGYDHAAFLALGQTLCRTAGVRRAKFPPIEECFSAIAQAHPRTLQKTFLTNYLGNVLQDYCDASRIRAEFSSLPPDTEGRLRSEDAAVLSDAVFAALGSGDGPVDASALQQELQDLIGRVWLAEKALDD